MICCALGAVLAAAPAQGDDKPAEEKWLLDRALELTPQPEPVPALRYRLFPLASELKEGNAVPIYLRLVHEQNDANRRRWFERPTELNQQPIERLAVAEAREFLNGYQRFFQQFDLGAQRTKAEWNYTLDQGSVIDILLPDAQIMRTYVPLQVLRVRVEIAEKNWSAAAKALKTGYTFSRHVSEAPFLITSLVGIACASQFTDTLLDFVSRPEAPNLYWSLTALPRPLIGLRHAMEFEQRTLEYQFPELTDLDRPRAPEQWDALLKKVRTEFERILSFDPNKQPTPPGMAPNDPAIKSPDLPAAKKYLTEQLHKPAAEVNAMPPARVVLLYVVAVYKEFTQDEFKAAYLPYLKAGPVLAAAQKRLVTAPATEGVRYAKALIPAFNKVLASQNRLERKIAALRGIEALRLYAAAHDGQLPDKLSQVTAVPVPDDPGTGKPFEYQRDGQGAVLISRIPREPLEFNGLRYRVTIRKK
jgi:hypothetical protein